MRTFLVAFALLALVPAVAAQRLAQDLTVETPQQDAVGLAPGAATTLHLVAHRACGFPGQVLFATDLSVTVDAAGGLLVQGPASVPFPQQVCDSTAQTVAFSYNVTARADAAGAQNLTLTMQLGPGGPSAPVVGQPMAASNAAEAGAGFFVQAPGAGSAAVQPLGAAAHPAPPAGLLVVLGALGCAAARRRRA